MINASLWDSHLKSEYLEPESPWFSYEDGEEYLKLSASV